jgi:tellurite resistance protein TerC
MDFISNNYLWVAFGAIILVMLVLDLGFFQRRAHAISTREAGIWTGTWVAIALLFGLAVYFFRNPLTAAEYYTGYIIEYSLSVDNLFVFVVIFTSFNVKPQHQHRVLFWGILGAMIMRGILIATGSVLLERFFWVAYIFGAFLVFTGIRLGFRKEAEPEPEKNLVLRIARRFLPMASNPKEQSFLERQGGKLLITPLFLVLVTIETTDLVFALDSIPAIFGITTDIFVVYTSNIFAVMGLRSLYFLLAKAIGKFYYLQTALAVILTFVGIKMLISHFITLPVIISLAVVIFVLGLGVIASLIRDKRKKQPDRSNNLSSDGTKQ